MKLFSFTLLCSCLCTLSHFQSALAADWPQWMGERRDGVWAEADAAKRLNLATAQEQWSVKVGGGYAGPAVSGGKAYLMSFYRKATAETGSKGPTGEEELLCVDALSGETKWKLRWPVEYSFDYASGPRVTPTVHEGRVYALGGEGHLLCAEADSGRELWSHELKTLYRCSAGTWGFSGHPLIFEDMVICLVGGEGSACVAFDQKTGSERWKALSCKQAGYCPPTLIEHEGEPQLMLWHGEAINMLHPRTGALLWRIPRETRFGVSMAQPLYSDGRLLVSCFWWGSKMLKLASKGKAAEPEIIWETEKESDTRTTHLNALMCSPLKAGNYFYGVCSYGQLRCLDWTTGERKWETFQATGGKEERWANAFLTRLGREGNDFLLANEQGELIKARLNPDGYHEYERRKVIEPNCPDVKQRPIVWSHPAYANGRAYLRNEGKFCSWKILANSTPTAQ